MDQIQAELLAQFDHHEHIYPKSDGEGTAGDLIRVSTDAQDESNGLDTTMNYWGEPKILIPQSTITEIYNLLGLYLYANIANKIQQWVLYCVGDVDSAKNGGNAWDEGATVLTVVDGSLFQTDDLVWIYSDYKTDGEIQKVAGVAGNVVTIVRETSQFVANNTGLRWDHTTNNAGTEVMYLAHRDDTNYHGFEGDFSAASAKEMKRYDWHSPKKQAVNCGVLMRDLNGLDNATTSFDVRVIWEED